MQVYCGLSRASCTVPMSLRDNWHAQSRHTFAKEDECTTVVDVQDVKLAPTMDLALVSDN